MMNVVPHHGPTPGVGGPGASSGLPGGISTAPISAIGNSIGI